MISNNDLKAAIVARLKAFAQLIAILPDGLEGVREYEWRGTDFQYPNVRVKIDGQVDTSPDSNCSIFSADWSVYIFSEIHSSNQADMIAGMIANYFRGSNFTYNAVKLVRIQIVENIPAVTQDERTWRAQVRCRSIVQ